MVRPPPDKNVVGYVLELLLVVDELELDPPELVPEDDELVVPPVEL